MGLSAAIVTAAAAGSAAVARLRARRVRRRWTGGALPAPVVVDNSGCGTAIALDADAERLRRNGAVVTGGQLAAVNIIIIALAGEFAWPGVAVAVVAFLAGLLMTRWWQRRELGLLGSKAPPPEFVRPRPAGVLVGVVALAVLGFGIGFAFKGLQYLVFPITLAQLKWADLFGVAPRTVGTLFTIGGFVVAALGAWLFRIARALGRARTKSLLERDHRRSALYLRSFDDDALPLPTIASARRPLFELFSVRGADPFEESVAWELNSYGPVVAVGRPGRSLATLGAAREHLPDETWREQVATRMDEAGIIAVATGETDGLAWELGEVVSGGHLAKTFFVFPPVAPDALDRRWAHTTASLADHGLAVGPLPVPAVVDPHRAAHQRRNGHRDVRDSARRGDLPDRSRPRARPGDARARSARSARFRPSRSARSGSARRRAVVGRAGNRRNPMSSRRVLLATIALVVMACDEEHATSPIVTDPPFDTTTVDSSIDAPVTTPDTAPGTTTAATTATTAAPDTLPVVTSTINGTAVAGNSGGVGPDQTDSFSEAVRNDDGTCSGWDGPGGGAWTEGLVVGAPVRILDRETDEEIGTGSVVSASFTDVDPGDRQQWVCNFAFTATIQGTPAEFFVAVADLAPWVARPDPTRPGEFVASVNTVADPSFFSQCTDDDFGEEVTRWSAAGLFWSDGISSVCSNGLHIEALDRPCRPPRHRQRSRDLGRPRRRSVGGAGGHERPPGGSGDVGARHARHRAHRHRSSVRLTSNGPTRRHPHTAGRRARRRRSRSTPPG